MSQLLKHNSRSLWLSASMLALMGAGAASAQTTVLTSGQYYDMESATGTAVEVPTGMTAYYFRSGPNWALPAGSTIINYSSTSSSESSAVFNWWWGQSRVNAPVLTVDSGATLVIVGQTTMPSYVDGSGNTQTYSGAVALQSMFNATGTVVFEKNTGSELEIIGNNKFLGDVILRDGATVQIGWDWQAINFATTFGPNTHFDLQGTSTLTLNPSGTGYFNGTIASSSSTSTFFLKSGTMVMNGQSTAFKGTTQVNGGATLMIGDSTHSGAVFGGAGAKINLTSISSTLAGYGTVIGDVTSNGIINAGGTSGVNGGLAITGSLTLKNTSVVKTAMTPTGVSGLTVNGNMVAAGELDINIASGTYGNGAYPLVVVNGGTISGAFSTVSTAGSVGDAIVGLEQTSSGFTIVTEKGSSQQVYGHLVYANRTALTNFVGSVYDAMAMTPASGAKVDTWITPIGEIENVSRDGLGYEQKTYGVSLGALHRFEGHGGVIGGAFSYRRGNMTIKDDTATASSNGYDLAIYGGAEVNQVRFDGSVFYNLFDAKTKRPMGTDGTSQGDQSGFGYGASGQISHEMFGSRVAPFVRGTYARIHLGAASEAGSLQYDLKHEAINVNTFATDLGIRAHLLRPQPDSRFKVDMDVAWRYDLSDPGETVEGGFANFSGGTSVSYWKGDSKNAFRVGLNATGQITDQIEAYTRIDGTLTSHRRAGELAIGAKYKF